MFYKDFFIKGQKTYEIIAEVQRDDSARSRAFKKDYRYLKDCSWDENKSLSLKISMRPTCRDSGNIS